eukprot:CAMPEP_0184484644 /NCGR_PEP_ID=MMETSP0113_2-20130426/6337_1 /TAXON_ID=91329 /ORGANISM="Norrisiella sphaerica, Strain BC52" /LENGTH=207 /DNA_ID=CAMNT_0026865723 /DNA_START=37 /DNA_END=660 /DNA_ORIENTATION=+
MPEGGKRDRDDEDRRRDRDDGGKGRDRNERNGDSRNRIRERRDRTETREEIRERIRRRDRDDIKRDRSPMAVRPRLAGRMRRERKTVDRQKICPLLLRVFCKLGEHHKAEEFKDPEREPTDDEFQIYTWKDATLGELTSLIKGVRKAARRKSARLSFAFVYPDRQGKKVVRVVGQTFSTRRSEDGQKSLSDLHFETGDYLDVAIYLK